MSKREKPLYTLIPLEEFKAVLGVDDRDDKLAGYCLVTSSYTIEQHCKRRFLRKKYFERLAFTGDLFLPFREYPVISINREQVTGNNGEKIEAEYYRVIPDFGTDIDLPFAIELSPVVRKFRFSEIKVVYTAGYTLAKVPPDLSSACLELASWNMARYKGRRIGTTGNVRGQGKDGEHFEPSMPENVKALLEPYRRKVI